MVLIEAVQGCRQTVRRASGRPPGAEIAFESNLFTNEDGARTVPRQARAVVPRDGIEAAYAIMIGPGMANQVNGRWR